MPPLFSSWIHKKQNKTLSLSKESATILASSRNREKPRTIRRPMLTTGNHNNPQSGYHQKRSHFPLAQKCSIPRNKAGLLAYDLRSPEQKHLLRPKPNGLRSWRNVPVIVKYSNGGCVGFSPIFPINPSTHTRGLGAIVTVDFLFSFRPPHKRAANTHSIAMWVGCVKMTSPGHPTQKRRSPLRGLCDKSDGSIWATLSVYVTHFRLTCISTALWSTYMSATIGRYISTSQPHYFGAHIPTSLLYSAVLQIFHFQSSYGCAMRRDMKGA